MLALADLDDGPRTFKSATTRMCAVGREVRPIDELIRFVVAPTGEVIADLKRKLPGRGMWVLASKAAVAEAFRRQLFTRGFRREVLVSPTLAADTEALLVQGVVDALAIAAKAGAVICGFTKVETALRKRPNAVCALIHASDGAADGIGKLDALVPQKTGIEGESARILIVTALTSTELDLALTRSNVVHAALLAGPSSKIFLSRSQKLVRYRMADDDKIAGTAASKPTKRTNSRR